MDLESDSQFRGDGNVEIADWSEAALQEIEMKSPGTLLNNCGFDLWHKRYVKRNDKKDKAFSWGGHELIHEPLSTCIENRERHVSQWAVQLSFEGRPGR